MTDTNSKTKIIPLSSLKKKIRNIFELDLNLEPKSKKQNFMVIKYNKNVYFNNPSENKPEKELNKYISNVLNPNIKSNTSNYLQIKQSPNNNNKNSISQYPPKGKTQNMHNDKNNQQKKNEKLNSNSTPDSLIYIPCMNCGNSIAIDDIENHSRKCTKVSKEILENESKNSEYYPIQYKLQKLKEHVLNIKNGEINLPNQVEKEMKYISTVLLQYINDTLKQEEITLESIKELKKIYKNLSTLSKAYKSSISSMIIIDRAKVLVNEKIKIYRDSYRMTKNTRKTNDIKKGNLIYENNIREQLKKIENIEKETELEKIKVKNLRKSASPNNFNLRDCIGNSSKDFYFSDNELSLELNKEELPNTIDVIISDIDNVSNDLSINTSMSNISTYKEDQRQGNNLSIINSINDVQKKKQAFYNLVLSQKFEKLHSTHRGQKISPSLIFKESQRLKIPQEEWNDFIYKELNNPNKYDKLKKGKLAVTVPIMDTIDEEK